MKTQSLLFAMRVASRFHAEAKPYHIRGMHAELHSELLKKCDERTKEKASAPSSSRQLVVATANFISDRSSVSAYIGPILSVIRISAKSYIGATLIKRKQIVALEAFIADGKDVFVSAYRLQEASMLHSSALDI